MSWASLSRRGTNSLAAGTSGTTTTRVPPVPEGEDLTDAIKYQRGLLPHIQPDSPHWPTKAHWAALLQEEHDAAMTRQAVPYRGAYNREGHGDFWVGCDVD